MKPLLPSVKTCVYCGRPTRGGKACGTHSSLLKDDPYYSRELHSTPNSNAAQTTAPQSQQPREAP